MKKKVIAFFITIGIMFLCSALLLTILSMIIWKLEGAGNILCTGVIAVYIICNLLGGFLVGRIMGQQKFFWGMITGCCYFLVLLLIGILFNGTKLSGNTQMISGGLICIISAMLGGMFAPVKKK